MTQVCFSHTSWGCLLARAGSVHLPRVAQQGQAQAVSGSVGGQFWGCGLSGRPQSGSLLPSASGSAHCDVAGGPSGLLLPPPHMGGLGR